jgi:putative holliday junction resolvase
MNGRTYMAFDFGERRIGVAIGNDLTESANPLTTIDATTDEARFSAIEPLVNDWQPAAFVVGHPFHPDGKPHTMTLRAEKFARQLQGRFRRAAHLVDERYSSVDAAYALANNRMSGQKKKQAIDAAAAAVILRRFFESGAHHTETNLNTQQNTTEAPSP